MKADRVYLLHIRDAIQRVADYSRGGRKDFFSQPMVQDAVVRNLEIIGEAVKNLSEASKARHPAVPWKSISGMRDKVIHEYFGVNLQLVWEVVERDLAPLKLAVEAMLKDTG